MAYESDGNRQEFAGVDEFVLEACGGNSNVPAPMSRDHGLVDERWQSHIARHGEKMLHTV